MTLFFRSTILMRRNSAMDSSLINSISSTNSISSMTLNEVEMKSKPLQDTSSASVTSIVPIPSRRHQSVNGPLPKYVCMYSYYHN